MNSTNYVDQITLASASMDLTDKDRNFLDAYRTIRDSFTNPDELNVSAAKKVIASTNYAQLSEDIVIPLCNDLKQFNHNKQPVGAETLAYDLLVRILNSAHKLDGHKMLNVLKIFNDGHDAGKSCMAKLMHAQIAAARISTRQKLFLKCALALTVATSAAVWLSSPHHAAPSSINTGALSTPAEHATHRPSATLILKSTTAHYG